MGSNVLAGFEGYENESIIYKTSKGIEIGLDILYPSARSDSPVPVLLHYHGGFLVIGDRYSFTPYWLVNACVNRGWIFVTPDYRLIPEATAHDSVEDSLDAFKWVSNSLPGYLRIDIGPIILAGSSAGGYLALTTCCLADQKPAALLSIYGMLNPANEHYITKGSNIFGLPSYDTTPVLEDLTSRRNQKSPEVLSGYSWPRGSNQDPRYAMMTTLHLEALFPDFIAGEPGLSEAIAQRGVEAIPLVHRRLFPLSFGLTSQIPPTILFHGKNDSAVSCSESQEAFERLRPLGVDINTEFPDDAEHGFDSRAGRIDIEKDNDDVLKQPSFDSLRKVLALLDQAVAASPEAEGSL